MHRRFTSLFKSPKGPDPLVSDAFPGSPGPIPILPAPPAQWGGYHSLSEVSTLAQDEQLPAPSSKIKRLDYFYSRWYKTWKYKVCSSFTRWCTML